MIRYKLLLLLFLPLLSVAQGVRDYAVELYKLGDQYPYGFSWTPHPQATSTVVYSKAQDSLVWHKLDSFTVPANSYIDSNLLTGQRRDYYVKEYRASITAHGYLSLGHQFDASHASKSLILVIDSTYIIPLASELNQLKRDLISENWKLKILYAGRSEPVTAVKFRIQHAWLSDCLSNTMVYLLGHIPVPYSGDIAPDGHFNHWGAWPAEVYYVNQETIWSDSIINLSAASSARNYNLPGDGKFDPDETSPLAAKMGIGRVDMFDMSLFGSDTSLIRQYLVKSHRFRTADVQFKESAIIDDNFGTFGGEAFAAGAWRNFSCLIPVDSIKNGDFRTNLNQMDYLFSYGCGGGTFQSASGIGTSAQLALDSLLNPFSFMFGSYFGDWDNPNNFLRAPLASKGWGLTSFWSGRPHAVLHHTALGDPIGVISLEAQKADSAVYQVGYGDAMIHTALMGDPSLPVYPLQPASDIQLRANCNEQTIQIRWSTKTSWDSVDIVLFDSSGTWQRIDRIAGFDTAWIQNFQPGTYCLGVQGRNLRYTPSGSFFQYSPILFDTILLNPVYSASIAALPDSICFGQSIHLSDSIQVNTGLQRSWSIDGIFLSNWPDTNIKLGSAGSQLVKLELVTDSGCYSADSISLFQMKEIKSNWQVNGKEFCFGEELKLEARASHGQTTWLLNNIELSKDSNWNGLLPSSGWHHLKLEVQDELGCKLLHQDSVRQIPPLLLTHGFSPVNHSICVGTPQERGIFQISSQRPALLYIQLDQNSIDTQNVQYYFAQDYTILDTGRHIIRWTLSDGVCSWDDSISFQAYPKASSPMTQTNWIHSGRNAALVVGNYYPKAHYYWGGSWDNGSADSIHKRYYGPASKQDGNYNQWVILEDSLECFSDTVHFNISLQTGIIPQTKNQDIVVYPNPSYGRFSYTIDHDVQVIEVLSSEGKIIRSFTNPDGTIRLDISPGIYSLRFKLTNGSVRYARICIQSSG